MGDSIENGTVVGIEYRLTVADGTEVDSTEGRGPMEYLHGHRNIIPGLESELEGHVVGDSLDVTVTPDQGYGEHDPERIIQISQGLAQIRNGLKIYVHVSFLILFLQKHISSTFQAPQQNPEADQLEISFFPQFPDG